MIKKIIQNKLKIKSLNKIMKKIEKTNLTVKDITNFIEFLKEHVKGKNKEKIGDDDIKKAEIVKLLIEKKDESSNSWISINRVDWISRGIHSKSIENMINDLEIKRVITHNRKTMGRLFFELVESQHYLNFLDNEILTITNKFKVKKSKNKKNINWNKWGVIIAFIMLILALSTYNPIKDLFGEKVLLELGSTEDNHICFRSISEFNSTSWKIYKSLPENFNMSNLSDYDEGDINHVLYFPAGFILKVINEKGIDLIEPKIIVSYQRPDFFTNSYIVEEKINQTLNKEPQVYTNSYIPKTFVKKENLYYRLKSPHIATIDLPDISKDTKKILVAVTFLVDLNNDCYKSFPVSFKLVEELHKIETDEKEGTISLIGYK